MKKILSILLVLSMFIFVGCGSSSTIKEEANIPAVSEENNNPTDNGTKQEDKQQEEENNNQQENKQENKQQVNKEEEPQSKDEEDTEYHCVKCGIVISKDENEHFQNHCLNCVKCINCGQPNVQTLKFRKYDGVSYTGFCNKCYKEMTDKIDEDNRLRRESEAKEQAAQQQAEEDNSIKYVICSKCGWNSHMTGQEYMYAHNKNGDAYNLDPNCDKCEKCGGQMIEP